MAHYTKQDTALQLMPQVEQHILTTYGKDSNEYEDWYWHYYAPNASWEERRRACVSWLRRKTQAENNGVGR